MVRFVKGHGHIGLALCDRPTRNDGTLLAIDDIHLILGFVIDIESWGGAFQGHGLESVSVDLDIGEFLARGGINDAEHGIGLMHVAAAVVDVEIIRFGIVADGIGVFQELHAGEQSVIAAIDNFQVASVAVGYANAIEIFTI